MRLAASFASNCLPDCLHFTDPLRHAARHDLIAPVMTERWPRYRNNRNYTAHDCDEDFGGAALSQLPAFIEDARTLAVMIDRANDD